MIKTWQENKDASDIEINTEDWMQDEIDELCEALAECDAEKAEQYECYQRVCREYHTQRTVMQQALEFIELMRNDVSLNQYEAIKLEKTETALREALEATGVPEYDQQTLDLCPNCGWKTVIPGELCLMCEWQKITNCRHN